MSINCPNCKTLLPDGFKFCGNCGTKVESSAGEAAIPQSNFSQKEEPLKQTSNKSTLAEDERRDVTVLFADVKGFTSMCERLDPEEVHTVMNACFKGLGQIIQAEGGHIDKYIGDNIMALFGAPIAHEDDPARACRAAIQMQEFLSGFASRFKDQTGVALQMRIGIHSGLVIAGGIGANETRKDYSVMGDTVNLASRLESLADPGSVLVSDEIAQRARGRFSFSDKSFVSVKGKEEPVGVRVLIAENSDVDTRGRDGFSTDLVGRTTELNNLIETWKSESKESKWIELRGDLGLGKTRLVEEARKLLNRPVLGAIATAVTQRRPYGLVRRLVQEAIRLQTVELSIPSNKDYFLEVLNAIDPSLNVYGDVLWFLIASGPNSIAPPDSDPQTLRALVETSIKELLKTLAKQKQGLTLVLDSYELSDSESAEVFYSLYNNEQFDLQFLITTRSEATSVTDTIESKYCFLIEALKDEDVVKLVEKLSQRSPLPKHIATEVVRLGGGNPLFIEELVREVQEFSPDFNQQNISLPASIRMSMVSRLDRLSPKSRDVLKRGSVQGVEFYCDVLKQLEEHLPTDNPLDDSVVDSLTQAKIILDDTNSDRLRLSFRQVALQEAAYETLLVRQRKEMHSFTAKIISELAGQETSAAPELLAYHYERADEWYLASHANLEEGRRASALFLNERAIRHLKKAEESLSKLGEIDIKNKKLLFSIYSELSEIHIRTGQYQDAESLAQKMLALADKNEEQAEALRLLASAKNNLGDLPSARDLLLEALSLRDHDVRSIEYFSIFYDLARLSHRNNENELALDYIKSAHEFLSELDFGQNLQLKILEGNVKHSKGSFDEAKVLYESAYLLAKENEQISELARVLNCLGNVYRDLGEYQKSKEYFEESLSLWVKTGNIHYIAGMHNNLGNLYMSLADYEMAKQHQEAAFVSYQKIGNVYGSALASSNIAMLALEQGDAAQGINGANQALSILGEGGNWLYALVLGILGDAYLLSLKVDDARLTFNRVLNEYTEANHPLAIAGATRGLGRVKLLEHRYEEADKLLLDAISKFEALKRSQESARTRLYRAEALKGLNKFKESKVELERALTTFQEINALGDVEKAKKLLG